MRLDLGSASLELEPGHPLLMGIVNANSDSVSDSEPATTLREQVERAGRLVDAGAALIDVGGDSGRTDAPPRDPEEEIGLVAPLVAELAARGVAVSIDTWKLEVAEAALQAGAVLVNDTSGLADERLAELAAARGAGLVLMHTRARPKEASFPRYEDPVADVRAVLSDAVERARARGVPAERLLLDPGLDYAKSPAESVEVLRRLAELAELGRPLLVAVSNKYFVGVVTNSLPEERLGGTLAALDAAVAGGAAILRVHDVAAAAQYLAMRSALRGDPADLVDRSPDDRLRWLPAE